MYSWCIDSILLLQAVTDGIKEKILPRRKSVFHIEHTPGSGYTPEAPSLLFKRLQEEGIPYLEYDQYEKLIEAMREKKMKGEKNLYNEENWGLADFELKEVKV